MSEVERNICPVARKVCDTAEVCWLIFCGRTAASATKLRPITERELTKAERYALHMERQRAPPTDTSRQHTGEKDR